jgi:microcystin-dependent protein
MNADANTVATSNVGVATNTSVLGNSVGKAGATNPAFNTYNTALASPTVLNPGALTAVGGSQPHENRQPYTALTVCIALYGIFPSRN